MRVPHLALSLGGLSLIAQAAPSMAQTRPAPIPQTSLWLSSERTASENQARTGFDIPAVCRTGSAQTSGFTAILAFALNFLFTEVAEAISNRELARVKALTDEYGALRNFRSFDPAATIGQRDCLIVEQRADVTANSAVRSLFVFAVEPVGDTAIALQPVLARVNATPFSGRAAGANVNVQLALSLGALVGGNCPRDEANCAPAEPETLGNPQFNFTNLTQGQSWLCEGAGGRTDGCAKMSGQSAAMPIARIDTPTTIGAAVTVTSVTLANATARQEMWERHRAALLEALNGAVSGLTD